MTIDISKLPRPTVIAELDVETIVAAILVDFRSRYPDFDAPVESDPSYKQIEAAAYREVLLRQSINDAAKAVLLAFSWSTNLEHLAALRNVERLTLDPGDPGALPPIDPTYEQDDPLRYRVQLAPEGESTAGPPGAYEFHALKVAKVKDVDVASPAAVQVVVTILSTDGDGTPDQATLDAVTAALANDRKVRPLTDEVTVQAATVVTYAIAGSLAIYKGFDPATILATALERVNLYKIAQHKLGRSITELGIKAALKPEGVHDVTLTSALPPAIARDEAAWCAGVAVTVGSIVDD